MNSCSPIGWASHIDYGRGAPSPYSIHLGVKKMKLDLIYVYQCVGMRHAIMDFVSKVFRVLASKGQELASDRTPAIHFGHAVEMRHHFYGFYSGFSSFLSSPGNYHGHYGQIDQCCSFIPYEIFLHSSNGGSSIYGDVVSLHGIPHRTILDRDHIVTSTLWT